MFGGAVSDANPSHFRVGALITVVHPHINTDPHLFYTVNGGMSREK